MLRGLSKLVVKRFARCGRSCSLGGSLCDALSTLIGRCSFPVYCSFPIKRIARGLPLVGNTRIRFMSKGGKIRLHVVASC